MARILLNGGYFFGRGRAAARVGLLLILGAAGSGATHADEARWRDTESRVQYGYYTADARALQNVADALASNDSPDKYRAYYAALVAWRQGLIAAQAPVSAKGSSAAHLLEHCVRELDRVLEEQPEFAEGYALRAACAVSAATGGGMHLPFTGPKPHKDIERALALAPKNPRVLFVDALADYLLPPPSGGNKERALPKLRKAVAAFELERAGPEPLPAWGAAEAYVYLGRDLLDHGDGVGARDALEHALLLAPEDAQARRLMAKITSG